MSLKKFEDSLARDGFGEFESDKVGFKVVGSDSAYEDELIFDEDDDLDNELRVDLELNFGDSHMKINTSEKTIEKEIKEAIKNKKDMDWEYDNKVFLGLIKLKYPTEEISNRNRDAVLRATSKYISKLNLFHELDENQKKTTLLIAKIYKIKSSSGVYF